MAENEKIDWILKRRSIRKYSEKTVDQEDIKLILKAGMYAPSAMNKQPWHFVVVDDRDLFARFQDFHPHAGFLSYASHAILVCGDLEQEHDGGFWILDCSAATQNILLAAHSLGIGSCWISLHPRTQRQEKAKELFHLPEHVWPLAMVSLGYALQERDMPERFSPEKIHYNTWGTKLH